jgi:hypothetical protein
MTYNLHQYSTAFTVGFATLTQQSTLAWQSPDQGGGFSETAYIYIQLPTGAADWYSLGYPIENSSGYPIQIYIDGVYYNSGGVLVFGDSANPFQAVVIDSVAGGNGLFQVGTGAGFTAIQGRTYTIRIDILVVTSNSPYATTTKSASTTVKWV